MPLFWMKSLFDLLKYLTCEKCGFRNVARKFGLAMAIHHVRMSGLAFVEKIRNLIKTRVAVTFGAPCHKQNRQLPVFVLHLSYVLNT